MNADSFVFSNKGGRSYNEDYADVKKLPQKGLFVLADGLGGHQHGELASKRAVESVLEGDIPDDCDLSEWLEEKLKTADESVKALQLEKKSRMKSTIVSLLISGDSAVWAHIGDSRLYYIHDGELKKITEDHSVAFKKYKAGEITRDQIPFDEDQSVLLRALGGERAIPVLDSAELTSGDGFLLCSDGVWEYLYDDEVLVDYLKSETASDWGELLLLRVMQRMPGDSDNLSLITVLLS